MWEVINNILSSPAGSFGFVFGIIVLFGFAFYKVTAVVHKFSTVEKMEDNIDKIKTDLAEIKGNISVFRQDRNSLVQTHSPVSLTPRGLEVEEELKVKRIVQNNWNLLYKQIQSRLNNDFNPYNIQEVCFSLGKSYSVIVSPDEFDYIKKYAYEEGLNLSDFDLVFGIVIRDKYFEAEEINVEEVDKHDPGNKEKA